MHGSDGRQGEPGAQRGGSIDRVGAEAPQVVHIGHDNVPMGEAGQCGRDHGSWEPHHTIMRGKVVTLIQYTIN